MMNIRTRLFLALGVMAALVVTGGLVSFVQMNAVQDEFTNFNDHTVAQISTFSRFKDNIHMAIANSHAYAKTGDERFRKMTFVMLNRTEKWEQKYRNVKNPEFQEEIREKKEATVAEIKKLVQMVDNGASEQAIDEQIRTLGTIRMDAMDFYHGEADTHFQEDRIETGEMIKSTVSSFILIIVILTLVAIGIAGGVGFYLSRSISRPLEKLTRTIEKISQGNLEVDIGPELKQSDDEIGELAQAFERTMVSLKLAMREAGEEEAGEDVEEE